MKMKIGLFYSGMFLAAVFAVGCSSMPVLTEPDPVPICISTYKDSELEKFSNVRFDFDFSDCAQGAMLVSKSVFGGASIEAAYPVRQLVEREFMRAAFDNFTVPTNDVPADVVVQVATMRMVLVRSQYTYTSDLSLSVKVFAYRGSDRAIFKKTYKAKAFGSSNDNEIPQCFYEALQNIVSEFISDMSSNRALIRCFNGIITKKENK